MFYRSDRHAAFGFSLSHFSSEMLCERRGILVLIVSCKVAAVLFPYFRVVAELRRNELEMIRRQVCVGGT